MKGAIVQLSRNCAYDLAKYKSEGRLRERPGPPAARPTAALCAPPAVRSNSVCAGTIETPISAEERAAHGWTYEEWQALKIKDVILQRVGTVREVAK